MADLSGKNIVLTAGSVLRGDDAVGPYLSKLMEERPIPGWATIDGGQTPEDDISTVRRARPKRFILVDAAAMGLPAGTVCKVEPEEVSTNYLMTTHTLPMSFLLSEIADSAQDVLFVGIQPLSTEFFDSFTPQVLEAVQRVYRWIEQGADASELPSVAQAKEQARNALELQADQPAPDQSVTGQSATGQPVTQADQSQAGAVRQEDIG